MDASRRDCGWELTRESEAISLSPTIEGRLAKGADLGCSPRRVSARAAERLSDTHLVAQATSGVVVLDVGTTPGAVEERAHLGEPGRDAVRAFYVVGQQIIVDRTVTGGDWGFESTSELDVWPTWEGAPTRVELPGPILSGGSDGESLWLLTQDSEVVYGEARTLFERGLSRLTGTDRVDIPLSSGAAPWLAVVGPDVRRLVHRHGRLEALAADGTVTASAQAQAPETLTGSSALVDDELWLGTKTTWRRFGPDLAERTAVDACATLPSPVGPLPALPVTRAGGWSWSAAPGPWGTGVLFAGAAANNSPPAWPPALTPVAVVPLGVGYVVRQPSGFYLATGSLIRVDPQLP